MIKSEAVVMQKQIAEMANTLIDISTNWSHIGGCNFSQFVQELAADPNMFKKPNLDQLVREDKSILLSNDKSSEYCELFIKIASKNKIEAMCFVCNVVKLEIFQGPINEYWQTIYGVAVDEPDELFKSYRYDVEIDKSGITSLTLKFLTDSPDVCIFGLMLHTSPNPNEISTLLPINRCIGAHNLFQDAKRTNTNSNKCENLLKLFTESNNHRLLTLGQHIQQNINTPDDACSDKPWRINESIIDILKSHIDERFKEFELHIHKYLEDMEQRQNKKLDKILTILDKTK